MEGELISLEHDVLICAKDLCPETGSAKYRFLKRSELCLSKVVC